MKPGEIMNEAVFCGRIVSIREDENSGTVTVACPAVTTTRRSGKVENGVRVNYPSLSYNKNTITPDVFGSFKRGDYVTIKGYVQAYLGLDKNNGETREITSLYIREMFHDRSKMEKVFGIPGRTYPETKNEVYLTGTLAGIVKRTERVLAVRLDLSTEHRNLINAVYYNARAGIASEYSIGDRVHILAMVQTVDTRESRHIYSYQDIVILDFGKPASSKTPEDV